MTIIDNEFTKELNQMELSTVFKDAITKMYEEFSFQVMVDLTSFKYDPKTYSAFVDLNLVSKEYAILKYFEPRLDTYIRDYLIYGVVEAVLENRGIDVYKPSLPEEYCEIDKYYTTKDYERLVGLEFVTDDEIKRIGYRYTHIEDYAAAKYLDTGLLDEIVVIDWETVNGMDVEKKKRKYSGSYEHQIRVVGASDVFIQLFGPEEGKAYSSYLKHVVALFQDTLGISTIPKLTAPMLFQHRIEEEKILKELAGDTKLGYRIIEKNNAERYPSLEVDSNCLIEKSGLREDFIKRKLYKALVGKGDYARSFLTSEYLYQQFNNNDRFDYTAVVSGYLKSVEQLMFKIVLQYIDQRDFNGRLYRVGSLSNKVTLTKAHVDANKISATMGNLIYFFKNDYPETIKNIKAEFKTTFLNCLEVYLDECRNQSFHKHNNYDWEKVEKIRNNTLIMYILLLAACSSENNATNTKHFAIIEDDRLERIYYWLRKKEMYTFKVKMPGEEEYLYVTRAAEEQFPSFDEYGLLRDFTISIRCTGKSKLPMNTERHLEISRECIPDELFYLTVFSEQPIDFSL